MTPDDPNHAPWFHTTPEAVLRAESILLAFHENRSAFIGEILAADYSDDAPPGGPVALLVALIVMANRLADHCSQLGAGRIAYEHGELLREAARVVAQAHYRTNERNTDG